MEADPVMPALVEEDVAVLPDVFPDLSSIWCRS